MAKDYYSKKESKESNVATFNQKKDKDKEQEVEASDANEEEELALAVTMPGRINYENDWIIDPGYSNHMTGEAT